MMKIDIKKIRDEAQRTEVSPHLLIKRAIGYKKSDNINGCGNCKLAMEVEYQQIRLMCEFIGVSKDFYSVVSKYFICNLYNMSNAKMFGEGEEQ